MTPPDIAPLADLAQDLGVPDSCFVPYGRSMAKVRLEALQRPRDRSTPPRLILVSAMTPTPAGEGKTTTAIGLADGLRRLGHKSCLALREPSLGPCFGMKGGGTGGGKAQLWPAADINLHFTGDLHAISSAHNLLAAVIDNHLHFRSALRLDPRRLRWRRVLDMNDRALRNLVVGLGGPRQSIPRETGFDITAASEVMAILCLAESREDLRARLDRILIGYDMAGDAVFAGALEIGGALLTLLKDAIHPNLVQTLEGTPAFVHGGPFANIAHGCNSVIATRMALQSADWVVTEAGFGFDLGAEKFFDIKCRLAGLDTAAVVLVATIRALKMHGGVEKSALLEPNPDAVKRGLANLQRHLQSVRAFGQVPVVAVNHFPTDTEEEFEVLKRFGRTEGVPVARSRHYEQGGEGALELAELVVAHAESVPSSFHPVYPLDMPVIDKVRAVCRTVYGGADVAVGRQAERDLKEVARLGFEGLPVCIAKTHQSLSDDPKKPGRPRDFDITLRGVEVNSGAGFLVVRTGDIMRMPGLPRRPRALKLDLQGDEVIGLNG